MAIFLTLVLKLIPLYVYMALGYLAGKFLSVKKESIAPLLLFVIGPVITFNSVATTEINFANLSLPMLFFILASFICLGFYFISKLFWSDNNRNILAFSAGMGNTGYFGLPVAIALFNSNQVDLLVLAILGVVLFENTIGFLIVARGTHTLKESLSKVIRLPALYAFGLGLIANLAQIQFNQIYADSIINFRGAFTILGMMLIGLGMSSIKEFKFDFKFISLAFIAKFLVWPSLILGIIGLDKVWLNLYAPDVQKVMILIAIVPLAANTVAYATEFKSQPEKMSLAVLISTLFALFFIPLITTNFF